MALQKSNRCPNPQCNSPLDTLSRRAWGPQNTRLSFSPAHLGSPAQCRCHAGLTKSKHHTKSIRLYNSVKSSECRHNFHHILCSGICDQTSGRYAPLHPPSSNGPRSHSLLYAPFQEGNFPNLLDYPPRFETLSDSEMPTMTHCVIFSTNLLIVMLLIGKNGG